MTASFTPDVNELIETGQNSPARPVFTPIGGDSTQRRGGFCDGCAGSTLLLENDGNSLFVTNAHVAEQLCSLATKPRHRVQIGDAVALTRSLQTCLQGYDVLMLPAFRSEKSEIEIIAAGCESLARKPKRRRATGKIVSARHSLRFPGHF